MLVYALYSRPNALILLVMGQEGNPAKLHQPPQRFPWGDAPCGLRVVSMDPLRFLAGCRTRRLNQA